MGSFNEALLNPAGRKEAWERERERGGKALLSSVHISPSGDAVAPYSSSSLLHSTFTSSFTLALSLAILNTQRRYLFFFLLLLLHRMDVEDVNLLKEQRVAYINSLICEGHLDEQFKQVQMLQDANNPEFVVDLINLYCQDSENILAELSRSLNEDAPDFKKIDASVHQLKGSSASVGANQVKLACIELRTCCEQANKHGCIDALNTIKQKFYILQNKLETLVQLEGKIQALEDAHL
ncbi:histidine-containing phosphotransfer protein 1-like [Nymphaea colorata]|nr:histidine-containing phosphotransfer protein 1-like [Nymphaea colorata]